MAGIWWEINMGKLKEVCDRYDVDIDKIMTKEKYGRFDISWTGVGKQPQEFYDELRDVEMDSNDICQEC